MYSSSSSFGKEIRKGGKQKKKKKEGRRKKGKKGKEKRNKERVKEQKKIQEFFGHSFQGPKLPFES